MENKENKKSLPLAYRSEVYKVLKLELPEGAHLGHAPNGREITLVSVSLELPEVYYTAIRYFARIYERGFEETLLSMFKSNLAPYVQTLRQIPLADLNAEEVTPDG